MIQPKKYTKSNYIKNLAHGNTEMRFYHFQCFLQNLFQFGNLSSSLRSVNSSFCNFGHITYTKISLTALQVYEQESYWQSTRLLAILTQKVSIKCNMYITSCYWQTKMLWIPFSNRIQRKYMFENNYNKKYLSIEVLTL